MHRVHNLFPADCRADLPSRRSTLIDNVFSRARDSRVFFVTARLFHPIRHPRENARLKIKSRWKNSGMLLRRCEVCTGEICAARILVSGTSAFHFRPRILKITAVERTPPHRDTATQISRGESRSRVARHIPFIPLFFPFSLREPGEVAPVFNDRVTTCKAVATNAKPRVVTRETRETIKTS